MKPADYVVHHLHNMVSREFSGSVPVVDFSYFNIDTVLWSLLMAFVSFAFLFAVSRSSTAGVPSRVQSLLELLVEFVSQQVRSIIPRASLSFIGPLALSVLVWSFLMNALDLIPVDLFPRLFSDLGWAHYHRIVPTADVNGALGMSLCVLILMFYYGIKVHRWHFFQGLFVVPFGSHPLLWLPNFIINTIEYFSKFFSLGLRLFGNMYAGELLFLLIALMGSTGTLPGALGHFLAGFLWAVGHIFIISLQAFIFMMLTIVYIGQAYEH